jgi:hypothetical protein
MSKPKSILIVALALMITALGSASLLSPALPAIPKANAANDFTISASPTSATIIAGGSATFTISLTSSGFSGTVSLSASVPPTAIGTTASLNPTAVTLTSTGTGTSTLTVSTDMSAVNGNFVITVTGTAAPRAHTTQVTVTVVGGVLGANAVPTVDSSTLIASVGLVVSLLSALAVTGAAIGIRNRRE